MSRTRSIIYNLPIEHFNGMLDELGLERTWHSMLATNISRSNRFELGYILNEKELQDATIQDFDFLEGLSVGEISVLYEYSLAYVDRDKRKQEGQYFTPDDVACVMAKKASEFPKNKVWVDPCSGIGNLSYWLIKQQKDPENFIKHRLYLIDRDPLALLVARCILSIAFQKNDSHLFEAIKPRFVVADYLLSENLPKYDYAILNPPYVATEPDPRFETSEAGDLYAYFLEKVIKTTSGFVSITPQTFTNGRKFTPLRRLLLNHFASIAVYCFDNVPDNIFRGIKFGSKNTNTANSTRAGIIVALNSVKSNKQTFMITPLLRWRTDEREELLNSIDNFLSRVSPTESSFPKLQKELVSLYDSAKKHQKTLLHLISKRPTPYKLIVPSTPRYFISALKSSVERSSFKTLYFFSEQEMNQAYLLINSSYMYWWWRINDGGMTLSEKTLLTLPLIDTGPLNTPLIAKLERSEKENRVVKKNAGKDNENVKHPPGLIKELNAYLTPQYATELEKVHNNSVIKIQNDFIRTA